VVIELDNLVSRARTERARDQREAQSSELERLHGVVSRKGWESIDKAIVGLARAYAEISDFESAVPLYERALRAEGASVTLKDFEQCANIRARLAADRAEAGIIGRRAAVRQIRTSIRDLNCLIEVGPTSERWSLLGSAYKRLAQTRGRSRAEKDIASMSAAYAKAAVANPDDLYPLLNSLAGILALGGPWQDPSSEMRDNPLATVAEFDKALAEARERAAGKAREAKGFWDLSFEPDSELLAALRAVGKVKKAEIDQQFSNLESSYRELFSHSGSARERASVTDQIEFLRDCFDRSSKKTGRGAPPAARIRLLEQQRTYLDSLLKTLTARK
jgi:tetratricopeptide (TPR) repeat protein